MRTVVVSGALANQPLNGGNAWTRLNWLLGFKRLGVDVYFVEQLAWETCIDGCGAASSFEASLNRAYFKEIADAFGLSKSAALISEDGQAMLGLQAQELLDLADDADLLINLGGHLTIQPLLRRFRCKVYVDDDPGFTQFWAASGDPGARLAGHDFYFTFGENIGTAACPIPTCGIDWRATRPPVVLSEWPLSGCADHGRFTTVASWRGPYGPVQFGEVTYGLKVHEFRKFIDLPAQVPQVLEIALDIHPADTKDRELLERHHWRIVEPRKAVGSPHDYRRYLQSSAAEFSVAKGIYVETNSGWFSDRTACYLACGRPVLVQDSGFSRNLPTGWGVVPFRTPAEAVAGARAIARDYDSHRCAARDIAETYFDSDVVLDRLLADVGLGSR